MAKRDYYDILGVAKSADDAALKAAFRKLAFRHKPVFMKRTPPVADRTVNAARQHLCQIVGAVMLAAFSGPVLAQSRLPATSHAGAVASYTVLEAYQKDVDAALNSRDYKLPAQVSLDIGRTLDRRPFIGDIERTAPGYAVLFSCEKALSSLSLIAVLAEGLIRRHPAAKPAEIVDAAGQFQVHFTICKTGLGKETPVLVTVARTQTFLQQLK
jgi:hypothetical protein